ncbi:MAG: PQQ-binding-like beta-propeller repeat protein [Phycisphaerales bacterium]|nr:PQQ-binding-like beta-propeller repeat protein [Phycisphaerales bacterium]
MRPAWVTVCGMLAAAGARAQDWTHLAGNPQRVSVAAAAVVPDTPRWVVTSDELGRPVTFYGQSGVVTLGQRVYARGVSGGVSRLLAVSRTTGVVVWSAPVPAPVLESWAAPTVDAGNAAVLVADGPALTAIDAATGGQRWQAPMPRPLVSVSPVVTGDLHPRDRAFVVDYDGVGVGGRLHCINVDPFDAALNPHQPGDELWSAPVGGTSGSTAAYAAGVVYVASASDPAGSSAGVVYAFPAGSTSSPDPLWATPNTEPLGFFGGVAVEGGGVYAASYAFSGGIDAANLVKLDAATGAPLWSVPCNRTSSIPVPLPGGLVALSGGLRGFGTVPSVQVFRDEGPSAARLWDSALGSWHDDNLNGQMDPGEYLLVGGWTQQPVMTASGLLIGALPAGPSTTGAPADLYLLDIDQHPSSPAFVMAHFVGAGASPAVADGWAFTVGPAGLYAFAPPCGPDCNADGSLNLADFGCFQTRFALGEPYADCNGDGVRNLADFGCFQTLFALGCP